MPYHPDHTTLSLFISHHLLTPTHLSDVVCSLCRQSCSGQHRLVQIAGHPQCQCVFGRSCILGFMRSGRAGANACPGCRVALWNVGEGDNNGNSDSEEHGDSGDGEEEDEEDDGSESYEEDSDVEEEEEDGSSGPEEMSWTGRSQAPTPPSSTSSSSSSFSSPPNTEFLLSPTRQSLNRADSDIDDIGYQSSHTLSASSSTNTTLFPITTFVNDLWHGTWDLVAAARPQSTSTRTIRAMRPRSEPITRDQLLTLIWNTYPFSTDRLGDAPMLEEELVFRARAMVQKHRRNGSFDREAGLSYERGMSRRY